MTPAQRLRQSIRAVQPHIELTDEQCDKLLTNAMKRLAPQRDILQAQDYSYRIAGLIQSEKFKLVRDKTV